MSNGPPFYDDDAVLLSWGESPKDGAWIKLQIKEDLIPDLRGLKRGAEHGERFTIVITGPLANDENSVARKGKTGGAGESQAGQPVHSKRSDGSEPPPATMGDAPTREDGDSLQTGLLSPTNSVTLVEGETGGVVVPSSSAIPPVPKSKRRWSEMPPSQRAALLTKEPEFCLYVTETEATPYDNTPDDADKWLKARIGVESKAELADNKYAVARLDQIEGNFRAWQQARGHGVI